MPDAGAQTAAVLTLSGDLDVASANDIVARGEALLDGAGTGLRMIVDVGGVEFIDSSGLSGLLRLRRLAAARGWAIFLRDVPPDMAALLRLTGTDQLLPSE